MKWNLDVNNCHSFIVGNYNFPYGKRRILLQKEIASEIVVDDNTIKYCKKLKPVCGFLKATVYCNNVNNPFLPIRILNAKKGASY